MDNAENSFDASLDAIRKLQLMLTKVLENEGRISPREMWCDEGAERNA